MKLCSIFYKLSANYNIKKLHYLLHTVRGSIVDTDTVFRKNGVLSMMRIYIINFQHVVVAAYSTVTCSISISRSDILYEVYII